MKMVKAKTIKGKIMVETGLHIGAGNDTVEIGGMDNPIIRNPLTGEPYIPGSSIKGKMRSLIEWKENKVAQNNGAPCRCGESDCPVCRVFGVAAGGSENPEQDAKRGPTRIIVRDAVLAPEWKDAFKNGKPIVESKSENTIDRLRGKAKNPRPIERVVPGVEFNFEMTYRVLDVGEGTDLDEKYYREVVLTALSLLQKDYLGGMGSRGSGRISFAELQDEKGESISLQEVV